MNITTRRKLLTVVIGTLSFVAVGLVAGAAIGAPLANSAFLAGWTGLGISLFEVLYMQAPLGIAFRKLSPVKHAVLYALVVLVLYATGIGVLLLFIPDPALRDAIIGRMPLSLPAVFAISVTILLILRVVSFIGARNLLHLMTGRYQRPMVEDRAFLFIDLKDSTRITEALGVVRAREFISDFIFDVSKAITDHRGDVYKFMGDGIIAVWQHQDKGALTDAVAAVVAAERALARRADRYENRFGHIPEFRAGLHAGEVIASEQGDLRRSIEFNGDHINIAARLEQKAKEHGRTLVFSEVVAEALHDTGVPTESLDEELVKGYSQPLRLYCLKV